MKNGSLLVLAYFFSLSVFSQIGFEKGYLITTEGVRQEVLIKNEGWKNNPVTFEYKVKEEAQTATLDQVLEFGVPEQFKYIKATIDIDRSPSKISELTTNRQPEFHTTEAFLKVLLEGAATLYVYEEPQIRRFFFSTENGKIVPLVYKKYVTPTTGAGKMTSLESVGENNHFHQQIYNAWSCSEITIQRIQKVKYTSRGLTELFIDYNQCMNDDFQNYSLGTERDAFNLSLRPGINISSLYLSNNIQGFAEIDAGAKSNLRVGIEAEYILPFNNNKWGLIIEPTYQRYEAQEEYKENPVTITYKSVEIPFGIRHYFFLNENSKIFLNLQYVVDISSSGSGLNFDSSMSDKQFETNQGTNFAFGSGFNLYNKFSIEARYHFNRSLTETTAWLSEYNTLSFIFGYNLF